MYKLNISATPHPQLIEVHTLLKKGGDEEKNNVCVKFTTVHLLCSYSMESEVAFLHFIDHSGTDLAKFKGRDPQ